MIGTLRLLPVKGQLDYFVARLVSWAKRSYLQTAITSTWGSHLTNTIGHKSGFAQVGPVFVGRLLQVSLAWANV